MATSLARHVTALVHGEAATEEAEARSAALFGGGSVEPVADDGIVLPCEAAMWPLWKLLSTAVTEAGAGMSTSEARRLIQQGGVEVDGHRASDIQQLSGVGSHTVKVGKRRIYRVIIEGP